ncbi:hypothetical protein FXO38_32632 [Capsicum annuum]|nr:hypothetical protein FXO37_35915 [Capsicum annuum]KAF3619962.1 hypothetical protein FXO38_32632 [Capsicum annuum]
MSAVTIHRVLFRLEYVALASMIEFEFRMIFTWDRYTMRDIKYKQQILNLSRWMATQISDLGPDSPLIEVEGEIKKAILYFTAKFWWTMLYFTVSRITLNNIVTWARDILVAILLVGYDIDFPMLI